MRTKVDIATVEMFGGEKDGVKVWETVSKVAEQLHWDVSALEGEMDEQNVLWVHNTARHVSLISTKPYWRYIENPE